MSVSQEAILKRVYIITIRRRSGRKSLTAKKPTCKLQALSTLLVVTAVLLLVAKTLGKTGQSHSAPQ